MRLTYVTGCPQRITARRRQGRQSQGGEICWAWLKLDVGMPAGGVVTLFRCVSFMGEHLLACYRGDMANFIIANAELGCTVQNGMDVKRRSAGFATQLAKTVYELFLKLIGEIILGAEEDYATLCNWESVSLWYLYLLG